MVYCATICTYAQSWHACVSVLYVPSSATKPASISAHFSDTKCCAECCRAEELEAVRAAAVEAGAFAAVTTNHHALGGAGAVDLGEAVVQACNQESKFSFLYDVDLSIKVGFVLRDGLSIHCGEECAV